MFVKEYIQHKFASSLYHKAYSRAAFTNWGIIFKEVKMCFKQFFTWRYPISSLLRSVKYAIFALSRIISGRSLRHSYGFTGEDRVIESLLKPIITYNGFYVDIGCNHPHFISNTFLFYRRGWRGICVDANEKLIGKFERNRPHDVAVCALVSNEEKEIEFTEYTNNVLSSADKTFMTEYLSEGQKVVNVKKMHTKTLTQILDIYQAPTHFDLLTVDAEEFDLLVLQSLDFNKYSPKLIVVEAEDFDPSIPTQHPIYIFLAGKEYTFKGFILKKSLFYEKNQLVILKLTFAGSALKFKRLLYSS